LARIPADSDLACRPAPPEWRQAPAGSLMGATASVCPNPPGMLGVRWGPGRPRTGLSKPTPVGVQLLLLFKMRSKTHAGMRDLDYAYVSVLEGYTGPRRLGQGYILHLMHKLLHIYRYIYHVNSEGTA
jgi:hypothetical protein